MTKWDGITERRQPQPDGKEGRRPSDQHCGQHEILWTHHEQDKESYRGLTCGKITKLDAALAREIEKLENADAEMQKNIVGKTWFKYTIGLIILAIGGLGIQQNWAFNEILKNQRDFTISINSIENNQIDLNRKVAVFEKEIEALNRRQDVLRDAHMKIVQGGTK